MILMAYLSYMLAEVSFSNTYGAPIVTFFFFLQKEGFQQSNQDQYFIYLAAILFKCNSHRILLWNCYVSLHVA